MFFVVLYFFSSSFWLWLSTLPAFLLVKWIVVVELGECIICECDRPTNIRKVIKEVKNVCFSTFIVVFKQYFTKVMELFHNFFSIFHSPVHNVFSLFFFLYLIVFYFILFYLCHVSHPFSSLANRPPREISSVCFCSYICKSTDAVLLCVSHKIFFLIY